MQKCLDKLAMEGVGLHEMNEVRKNEECTMARGPAKVSVILIGKELRDRNRLDTYCPIPDAGHFALEGVKFADKSDLLHVHRHVQRMH